MLPIRFSDRLYIPVAGWGIHQISLCRRIALVRNKSHLFHGQLVHCRQLVRQHFSKLFVV